MQAIADRDEETIRKLTEEKFADKLVAGFEKSKKHGLVYNCPEYYNKDYIYIID